MASIEKPSIYDQVTSRIVAAMESNLVPWRQPWLASSPINAVSGRAYRGINVLLLTLTAIEKGYRSRGWISYKAALDHGGNVRRGEKATAIVWWDKKPRARQASTEPVAASASEDNEWIWFARTYSVFNVDQCDGLDDLARSTASPLAAFNPLDRCEGIVAGCDAVVMHGGASAYYDRRTEVIVIPPRDLFVSSTDYYATLFHELVHWTGAPQRLDRETGGRFGDEKYAFEELVAELGAAFLSARCGIEHISQSASYIASWVKVLRSDNRAIFTAARLAGEAADYLAPAPVASDEEVRVAA